MFTIVKGNIVEFTGDCIVNAANREMRGGGGVDGAIHRAAGYELSEYQRARMRERGDMLYLTGEPMWTPGFKLPVSAIIHVAGPQWSIIPALQEKAEAELKACYQNVLKCAQERGYESIAFPSISTGVYRFPLNRAAEIAVPILMEAGEVMDVSMVCYDDQTYAAYENEYCKLCRLQKRKFI